jgi:hypothetical protein
MTSALKILFFRSGKKTLFFLFAASVLLAFAVRTFHFSREAASVRMASGADFSPFTRDGSIMYHYARLIAKNGSAPKSDSGLLGMENESPASQMSLGLEYFLACGYKIKCLLLPPGKDAAGDGSYEDSKDFSRWISFQIRLWASLTAGFIFLWLSVLRLPCVFAFFGAALWAVAPAAIARSTGQDLLRGEFCMPFIAASFLCAAWTLRRKTFWPFCALFLSVFCAMSFWDLTQLVLTLWIAADMLRYLLGGKVTVTRLKLWTVVYGAVLLSAVLVPYNVRHLLILSPLALVAAPLAALVHWLSLRFPAPRLRFVFLPAALALLLCVSGIAGRNGGYAANYSHFSELFKAKITNWQPSANPADDFVDKAWSWLTRHNVKPKDPSKLSFEARILWTPSMNSADPGMTRAFFPAAVWFFIFGLAGALCFRRSRLALKRALPAFLFPGLMALVFFMLYHYIVRYHEFCALFLSASLPLLGFFLARPFRRGWGAALVFAVLLLCLALETNVSLRNRRNYSGSPHAELAGLVKWLRASDIKGKSFLADMTISPLLRAYCGAKILLQLQFELPQVRRNVEEYLNVLFNGTEKDLNEFCRKNKIDFYVYDLGDNYLNDLHIYSNRYMAAAVNVKKDSAAYIMGGTPYQTKYFYAVQPPPELAFVSKRFIVYRALTPEDAAKSEKLAMLGLDSLGQGRIELAGKLIKAAFVLNPLSDDNYLAYYKFFNTVPRVSLSDYSGTPSASDEKDSPPKK